VASRAAAGLDGDFAGIGVVSTRKEVRPAADHQICVRPSRNFGRDAAQVSLQMKDPGYTPVRSCRTPLPTVPRMAGPRSDDVEEDSMPNGHDKNWNRLCAAIDGFRSHYGRWPSRVRIMEVSLRDFDFLFTPADLAQITSKVA
jgi:hypothetical protein